MNESTGLRGRKLNIAICEDDLYQREAIERLLSGTGCLGSYSISAFSEGEALVDAYETGRRFDLVFMDMQLPGMDGIEVASNIRERGCSCLIVIVTSIMEYAMEGYGVDAFDFILKPVTEERFSEVVAKAAAVLLPGGGKVCHLSRKGSEMAVPMDSIAYIESFGRSVLVHCKEGTYEHASTISREEERLKDEGFLRISRYYLVNMKYIREIQTREIRLAGGRTLSINPKRRKAIYDAYTEYAMEVLA